MRGTFTAAFFDILLDRTDSANRQNTARSSSAARTTSIPIMRVLKPFISYSSSKKVRHVAADHSNRIPRLLSNYHDQAKYTKNIYNLPTNYALPHSISTSCTAVPMHDFPRFLACRKAGAREEHACSVDTTPRRVEIRKDRAEASGACSTHLSLLTKRLGLRTPVDLPWRLCLCADRKYSHRRYKQLADISTLNRADTSVSDVSREIAAPALYPDSPVAPELWPSKLLESLKTCGEGTSVLYSAREHCPGNHNGDCQSVAGRIGEVPQLVRGV